MMSTENAQLSWKTRIAYGLGDTAQNVVWGAMGILTFFYTDYAGIDPAIVGLVMLLSRCFDGFSDVVMALGGRYRFCVLGQWPFAGKTGIHYEK